VSGGVSVTSQSCKHEGLPKEVDGVSSGVPKSYWEQAH